MNTFAKMILLICSPVLMIIYWRNELKELTLHQNQNTDEDMALLLMNSATTL